MAEQTEYASSMTPHLEAVLDGFADAISVVDDQGHYVYANEMAAHLSGYESVEELLQTVPEETRSHFEVMNEAGQPVLPEDLPGSRAQRGENPPPALLRSRDRRTGEERWTRLQARRITDPETAAFLTVNIFQDVTDEVRADRARSFVAEASAILAGSLDYDATLKSLAQLAVPEIADWCAVDILDEDGQVRQIVVAHVDPEKVELARVLGERYPYDPHAAHGVPRVIRTGEPELIREIPNELLDELSADPELLEIVRELGLRSSMVVPLVARGRVLGAITMVSAESGRLFDDRELSLAMDLATRAAVAVDNAQLYREAKRSSAELEGVLSQMSDAVVITDAEGHITFFNPAATRIFGDISVGTSMVAGIPGTSRLTVEGDSMDNEKVPIIRALRGERITGVQWRFRREDGTEVVLETSATPLRSDEGLPVAAVGVSRDITPQFDFERQKDNFLLATSHDLKNPLTLIKGTAQMLARRVQKGGSDLDEQLLAGLARIDSTATRMANLVNEMLDVTRIRMGRPLPLDMSRPTDIVAVVNRLAEEFQTAHPEHDIRIDREVPQLVGRWDEPRIERAIANLLSNAVKFTPHGGHVGVTVAREERDGVPWARISVADTGVGIPQEDVPHIFEQFRRGENVEGRISGSGIGLAGVRQIVEAHGGSVEVQSKQGAGSTFTIRLPTQPPPPK